VSTDLSVFRTFRPCGLSGEVMTSISREREVDTPIDVLRGPMLRAWESVFGGQAAVVDTQLLPTSSASANS
jgi:lipoate-protein ligase B